jgi:uracil-DNA glycosylase
MGIDRDTFYDPAIVAIVPMGFCYPGTGRSGDFPPRPECAPAWREALLEQLTSIELTLIIGQYAQAWHLGPGTHGVTETVRDWPTRWPRLLPLPHPSPRNGIWIRKNAWFEQDVLPALRHRIAHILGRPVVRRRARRN